MNQFMQTRWPWIEGTLGMRTLVLDTLSDADLAFNSGGQNMTLGELCREIGEIEYSYIQSLKTFKQDWSYHNMQVGLDSSVAQLKAWYQALDDDLKATLSAFSDEDMKKEIDRGTGYMMPVELQLDVYLQSLFISLGKTTIYLKAMNKPMPKPMQDYIG